MLHLRWILCSLMAAALLLAAGSARGDQAQSQDWNSGDVRFSIDAAYLYGPADGYLQVPSGGEPGTSSKHRPKLNEIGIDDANIADIVGRFGWHNEELYLGAQIIRLSGDDTLDESLTSHAATFPAGSRVSSDVTLDWYRFGYRHRFSFLEDRSLRLYPSIGGAVLNFDYTLDSPGSESAKRSYVKANVQLGLAVEWQPNRGPFSVGVDLLGSPPFSSLPFIGYEDIVAKYRFIDTRHFDGSVFAGVAFEQIDFHDDQTVSNRINVDFGPMIIVGLGMRF
jgi:hypothetical protein